MEEIRWVAVAMIKYLITVLFVAVCRAFASSHCIASRTACEQPAGPFWKLHTQHNSRNSAERIEYASAMRVCCIGFIASLSSIRVCFFLLLLFLGWIHWMCMCFFTISVRCSQGARRRPFANRNTNRNQKHSRIATKHYMRRWYIVRDVRRSPEESAVEG